MNDRTLEMIQGQIGYRFNNTDLLQQAFVRRSYSKEKGGENNEILEFIGDKVLDFIIVKRLSEKYGSFSNEYEDYNSKEDCNEFVCEHNEGRLTEIKKKLVCRENLARRIRAFGFQHELIMGKSDLEQSIYEHESAQEDLFEAIVGAVALDCNWNISAITAVIDLMLEPDYCLENGFEGNDYVVLLQQWYQKKHNKIPVYNFKETYFPLSHFSSNLVQTRTDFNGYECWLGLYPIEEGFWAWGKTKREARMFAAKKAYEFLEKNDLLVDLIDEVGEPHIDRAINQLQELYQKGYIGEPWYKFAEGYDKNGNPLWNCECHVEGKNDYWHGEYCSKKQGKKRVAYNMLCEILGWEEEHET